MPTLGNSDTVLISTAAEVAGAGTTEQLLILKALVNNQDAGSQSVIVYRVPQSGSADPSNVMVDTFTLDPGETRALPISGESVINGQSLQMSCSASGNMVASLSWMVIS